MTWAVAWRPLAERDLIDCAAHIAQDNTNAALRFIDAVEDTVASLAESPMLSTATHFAHPDLAGVRRPSCERVQALSHLLPQSIGDTDD
jgi:plasmid stabilization system protein ParE